MINVPVFYVVLLIVLLHTILQHLLSWGSRSKLVATDGAVLFFIILGWFFEGVALIITLEACLPT